MSAFTDRLDAMFSKPRTPYRILRPDVVHDVPGVSAWLRRHHEGGWLQSAQTERDSVARRLLFAVYRIYARHLDVLTDERASIAGLDALAAERRAGI